MVVTMDKIRWRRNCIFIDILQLESAFLVVPPLYAKNSLVLIHIQILVEIEIVVRPDQIQRA